MFSVKSERSFLKEYKIISCVANGIWKLDPIHLTSDIDQRCALEILSYNSVFHKTVNIYRASEQLPTFQNEPRYKKVISCSVKIL
jgi:hypothetical protein